MQTKFIIAISIAFGLSFVAAMALIRLLVQKHTKNDTCDDTHIDGSRDRKGQLVGISSSWKRLFALKRDSKNHWVPSLSGILKAGDEGLCSSAMFINLLGSTGNISVDALYKAFAIELQAHPIANRSLYSQDVVEFMAKSKRGTAGGLEKTRSISHKAASRRPRDLTAKSIRKSLDISIAEVGLVRAISVKRQGPVVPMNIGLKAGSEEKQNHGSWMKDGQNATYHDGLKRVKVTSAELAVLSVVLGSPLNRNSEASFERGAYGITIRSSPSIDGKRQVTLQQNIRSVSQHHAQGKGSSLLFSKHLAAGSLPYSQDMKAVKSILITAESLEAIRAGASTLTRSTTARTPQSRFLSSLPNSRDLSFQILASSAEAHQSATLTNAISALPFVSGLTPLATKPMINAICFIASGGLPPGRLLSRLESLIEKVHRQAPHLTIFGPMYEPQNAGILYRERQRLSKVVSDPSTTDTLADKTARMSRYITLLERLMVLMPNTSQQDSLTVVREATKVELQRSYANAVAVHTGKTPQKDIPLVTTEFNPTPEPKTNRKSVASRTSFRLSKRQSTVASDSEHSDISPTSPRSFTEGASRDLGKQLEQVLKMELPLNVPTVAYVARMVIVAWTLSVETVAWEYGESGFRVPDIGGLGDMMELC